MAKAQLRSGDIETAEATISRSFAEVTATGETWAEPELHRIRGKILLLRNDEESAKAAFETAVSIAKSQGSTSLYNRAKQSLDQISKV